MKSHQTINKQKKYSWFSFLSAGLVLLLLATGYFWIVLNETGRADLLLFFGRFHILLVHLPIALLLLAAIMEIFSRFRSFDYLGQSVTFVLTLAAISSVISVLAGFMLSTGGGYNESLLNSHKWWGIGFTVFTFIALGFKIFTISNLKLSEFIYSTALFIAVVSLFAASHFGGSLTHGQNYLTAYMPGTIKNLLFINTDEEIYVIDNIEEATIFADLVFPIFNDRCISCHNPDRIEGELRLDTFDQLIRGGESGPVIVSSSPAESDLFRRIIAPRNDDGRMPPGNRRPLTEHQVAIIQWWITEGAHPDLLVGHANRTPEMEPVLARLAGLETEQTGILSNHVEPANATIIAGLINEGIVITPVSQQHNYLRAGFVNVVNPDPGHIQSLHQISSQLAWLDLSHTPVTDDHLLHISGLHSLTRLNLNYTLITDVGIRQIEKLENLEHLSLAGTAVTDAALETLSELPNLRQVYIWQTNVTDDGADWLIRKNPLLKADRGYTLTEPDTIILPAEAGYSY